MSRLFELLNRNVDQFSQHEAIIEESTRWTYQDFLAEVNKAASAFKALQVNPGDRVGLMLYNQKEFLVCFFALRKIGAVVVPINIQMLQQDIGFVIQNSGIRLMVLDETFYPNLRQLPLRFIALGAVEGDALSYQSFIEQGETFGPVEPVATEQSDLAFLLYTSGTTGHPKGVMLSEKNILANLTGFEQVLEFNNQDRMILALPLFHAFGLIIALAGISVGATIALIPKFHPRSIIDAMVHEKATVLPLVPTLYTVILDLIARKGGIELPHLRFCVSGGASLPSALLHRIETELKTTVIEGYGLTETSPVLTVNDPKKGSIPACVGKPLPNVQVRILCEDGSDCPQGQVGEVVVRGDNVMSGYFNLPEETRAVFTADGWFRTGDLGHLDDTGNLFISGGRKKDIIIKAGENISPLSIEQVLYHHPAVREAAVIGVPDAKLGEELAACVSLKEGQSVTAQELIRFCREQLLPAYVPGYVEFFDELPKTPSGKIVKKFLKEMMAQRVTSTSA